MKLGFILLLNTFVFTIKAQNGLGSWNILNFSAKIDSKWSFFVEPQLRSLAFYNDFHYYEYKAGLTYKITNNFSVTTGIGNYNTYSENGNFEAPIQNKETRTWLQMNVKTNIGRTVFENRFRTEQRFASNGYRNRFRLRFGATVPINNLKTKPKTISAVVWNEIFFTNNEPYFERNRFFAGFGYEVNKNFGVQTGFIQQFDYKINDETGRHFFNISLLYHIDLSNKKGFSPTTID